MVRESSSSRSASTLKSGDAAMSSRQGAFDPGAGLRPVFSAMPALSLPAAIRSGGTIDAVTRLPPDAGPSGRLELPMRTSTSCGSSSNSRAIRVGDDAAGSGADVLGRDAGHEAPVLDRERDLRSELPEIEPVARGDADAAAVAAALRLGA